MVVYNLTLEPPTHTKEEREEESNDKSKTLLSPQKPPLQLLIGTPRDAPEVIEMSNVASPLSGIFHY